MLSAIYGGVARLHRSWYDARPQARRRLDRPVISVGNLVVGGSGKTPVVAALARLLHAEGRRPVVLSRGYARRAAHDGVVVVSDGRQVVAGVEASGDEPQMLARALPGVPVLVSSSRYRAGRAAEQRFDVGVHVLDDGFQHLALDRTLDLLIVAPEDLEERLLPSGRLREPLSAARRADAVLVYGSEEDAARIAHTLGVARAFTVERRYAPLRPLVPGADLLVRGADSRGADSRGADSRGADLAGPTGEPDKARPMSARRVIAVAGIARPERFFDALRAQGLDVARELVFRDHHWYAPRDVARVAAAAREARTDLVVTTEKDAVRLESLLTPGGDVEWAVLPMAAVLAPACASWLRERL